MEIFHPGGIVPLSSGAVGGSLLDGKRGDELKSSSTDVENLRAVTFQIVRERTVEAHSGLGV